MRMDLVSHLRRLSDSVHTNNNDKRRGLLSDWLCRFPVELVEIISGYDQLACWLPVEIVITRCCGHAAVQCGTTRLLLAGGDPVYGKTERSCVHAVPAAAIACSIDVGLASYECTSLSGTIERMSLASMDPRCLATLKNETLHEDDDLPDLLPRHLDRYEVKFDPGDSLEFYYDECGVLFYKCRDGWFGGQRVECACTEHVALRINSVMALAWTELSLAGALSDRELEIVFAYACDHSTERQMRASINTTLDQTIEKYSNPEKLAQIRLWFDQMAASSQVGAPSVEEFAKLSADIGDGVV